MAVMQIVDVVAMLDCGVPTTRTVHVVMVGVMRFVASAHASPPLIFAHTRPSSAIVGKNGTNISATVPIQRYLRSPPFNRLNRV